MKHSSVMTAMLLATFLFTNTGICDTKKGEKVDGKKEFEEHCEVCHPNGGNLINSKKPLTRKALRASGVKSAKDIIDKIRNPGPDMTKFDENTISNKEAKAIAEYVLKTFK